MKNTIDHWQDADLGELDMPATPAGLYLQLYPNNEGPRATEAQEAILAANGITAFLYATCVTKKSFPAGEATMEKIGLRKPCLDYFFVPCKDNEGNEVLHIKNTLASLMAIGKDSWLVKYISLITRVYVHEYTSLPDSAYTVYVEHLENPNDTFPQVSCFASIVRPVDYIRIEYTVTPTLTLW